MLYLYVLVFCIGYFIRYLQANQKKEGGVDVMMAVFTHTTSSQYKPKTLKEICYDIELCSKRERQLVFRELEQLVEDKTLRKERDASGRMVYINTSKSRQ